MNNKKKVSLCQRWHYHCAKYCNCTIPILSPIVVTSPCGKSSRISHRPPRGPPIAHPAPAHRLRSFPAFSRCRRIWNTLDLECIFQSYAHSRKQVKTKKKKNHGAWFTHSDLRWLPWDFSVLSPCYYYRSYASWLWVIHALLSNSGGAAELPIVFVSHECSRRRGRQRWPLGRPVWWERSKMAKNDIFWPAHEWGNN